MDEFSQVPQDLAKALRRALLDLARREDQVADTEAALVPYWAPHPPSVQGHRQAALALRGDADKYAWAC